MFCPKCFVSNCYLNWTGACVSMPPLFPRRNIALNGYLQHLLKQGVEQSYIFSKMRVRLTRGCRIAFSSPIVVTRLQAHPAQIWRSVLFFNRWLVFTRNSVYTKRLPLVYSINHTLFLNNAMITAIDDYDIQTWLVQIILYTW